MSSQNPNPNEPKSPSKGGQPPPQSQQEHDAHTNSSRAGERPEQPSRDRSDPNRKASNQPGGGQQGFDPSRQK